MSTPAFALESDSGSLLEQAAQLGRKGRWEDAAQLYHAVLAQAPDQPDAWEGLGLAALHGNRAAEGLGWLLGAQSRAAPSARLWTSVGIAQRRNGQLAEAVETFGQAFALDPQPSILLNRARAERQLGQLAAAIGSFQQALALDRNQPEAWSMLSNALREAGLLDEALTAAEEALARNPWFGEAHLNEGVALHQLGRRSEASVSYWVASTRLAQPAAALSNLNKALAQLQQDGPLPSEVQLVQRLLRAPGDAALARALGQAAQQTQRVPAAIACLERAAELEPRAATYLELGMLVCAPGRVPEAQERVLRAFECADVDLDCYRRLAKWLTQQPRFRLAGPRWEAILARCPDDVEALVNLGVALQRQGLPSAAVRCHERVLGLAPNQLEALINHGAALSDLGHFVEASAAYQRALQIDPNNPTTASNLLFSLHFDPSVSPETILAEHRRYADRFGTPEALDTRRFRQTRDPDRRLRIGYVSPDFRWHPVAYFIEPVLSRHAPAAVEVYCYSDTDRPDTKTAQLAALVPHFIACAGWSDADLARRISEDQIDILVDLTGHTARNRMLTFGRKPAPIQVSWIGYFDTTGLPAIDYRIADRHSVTAETERLFVEQVVHLPRSSNCFAHPDAPEPAPPPCLTRGYIRFGCFNNPAKLTREGVATFARILRDVEGSRLLLKYGAFDDPVLRARYQQWFQDEGIAPERLEIQGHTPLPKFLAGFAEIDIALDPFPYSGETTALHTLWMGVPLVALEGTTLVQRLASRVLRVAGLSEWVARSEEEYVRIARTLARDPAELARRRVGLRGELRASALCDHEGVTREVEELYRGVWRRWCEGAGVG